LEEKIREILDRLLKTEKIEINDIPNIDLYMDQVTTFMNTHLSDYKRYPEDKIMTKTMINNYSKNRLLPPSNKKRYSREHVFLLIMIYYYKSILSISDIQNLLSPLSEKYFPASQENGLSLEEIYGKMTEQMEINKPLSEEQILATMENNSHLFDTLDMKDEDREEMAMFTFISQLCYDIYLRKQLIERLLDQVYPPDKPSKKSKPKKE